MLVTTARQLSNMTKNGVLKSGRPRMSASREELKILGDTGDHGVILSGRNKIHAIHCKYVLTEVENATKKSNARVNLSSGCIIEIDEARCLGYSISKS